MLYFFIKTDSTWANVSDDVVWDSLKIQENLGEQSNTADFRMIDVRPISGQEVSVYDGTKLTTARTPVGRTLSVEDAYTDANKFRAGDRVWLDPRGAKEEFATVSVASDNRIILTANTQNTHSVGVIVAKKKFAGHILRTPDTNIRQIDDVEVAVQCVDYTREFSRKLINEGWTNSNALTIIRDMLRDTINGGLTAPFTASVDDVDIGTTFSVFKAPFKNAMSVMQRLADELGDYHWYIDYDRRVHFGSLAKEPAPISIDRNGQSFANLGINVDLSQLKNQQVVLGGYEFSGATVEEIKAADSTVREWVLRNKFKNLALYTSTDSTSFWQTQSVLPDFLFDEADADYFSNFQGQSVRAAEQTLTLTTGHYIRFVYNEQIPIEVLSRDDASVTAVAALGFGDGIIDGRPIVDANLDTREEAQARADAELLKYANTVIEAEFETDQGGLRAGQKIRIIDTGSMRNINQDFLIQRVQTDIYAGQYSRYKVKAASSLFGVTELIHRLLKRDESLFVDENATVRKIALFQERLAFTESYQITSPVTTDETLEMTESWATRTFEPPFTWGEFSTVSDGFWNLASWD